MYRINLYPEHEQRRRANRRGMALTAALAGLLGIEALLAGSLAVSGVLLGERIRSLQVGITELSGRVNGDRAQEPGVQAALELLEVRGARILWAPKLTALSDRLDRELILGEVRGQSPWRERPARLDVRGLIRGSNPQVGAVSVFVEALRAEPRIAGDFPRVRLETIEDANRFHVTCSQGEVNP